MLPHVVVTARPEPGVETRTRRGDWHPGIREPTRRILASLFTQLVSGSQTRGERPESWLFSGGDSLQKPPAVFVRICAPAESSLNQSGVPVWVVKQNLAAT